MAKRLLVAYGLWALGGPLGLHHLYLGRDSQALLWLLTLGGCGAGWLCDAWHLPGWVAAANGAGGPRRRGEGGVPAPGPLGFAGQVAAGTYLGVLAGLALPGAPAVPLASALGVQLAASAGERTAAAGPVLAAALLAALLCGGRLPAALPASLAAAAAARRHRRCKRPGAPGARLCRLALAYAALAGALAYAVLGRAAAVAAAVLRLPQRAGGLLAHALGFGAGPGPEPLDARRLWAYQVLGLAAGSSAEDVHRSYRELVKVWHPDHNRHRAEEAERRFIELQEAYEELAGPRKAPAASAAA
ncbi:dnaJ homolog subfamily C member 22 [Dromaius novaehollandiae]|uniref:dnaJ homolog subfamily C member 22 n=1 Tax=Dromaius novaehollandiae TaxID=8790 RepID=UPI00312024E3